MVFLNFRLVFTFKFTLKLAPDYCHYHSENGLNFNSGITVILLPKKWSGIFPRGHNHAFSGNVPSPSELRFRYKNTSTSPRITTKKLRF